MILTVPEQVLLDNIMLYKCRYAKIASGGNIFAKFVVCKRDLIRFPAPLPPHVARRGSVELCFERVAL